MEAQTLCTLFPSVKHAIFIGDPLQLRYGANIRVINPNTRLTSHRPQVNEPALSLETAIGSSYRLDESLMERMMVPSVPGVQPIASSRLDLQRRMHPDIADLMCATLYPFLQVCKSLQLRWSLKEVSDHSNCRTMRQCVLLSQLPACSTGFGGSTIKCQRISQRPDPPWPNPFPMPMKST